MCYSRVTPAYSTYLCAQDEVLDGGVAVPLEPVAGLIPLPLHEVGMADVHAERELIVNSHDVRKSPSATGFPGL